MLINVRTIKCDNKLDKLGQRFSKQLKDNKLAKQSRF